MSKLSTISILGCGWLGLPLAKHLVSKGFTVKGSTTTESKLKELESVGVQPYLIALEPEVKETSVGDFFNSDLLFVNIPPGLRFNAEDYYLQQLASLIMAVNNSSIRQLIFISTTSVYPELNREVTEADADQNHPLAKAEQFVIQKTKNRQVTVLRCGGLMGYDRIPAKYFAGKKGLTTGDIRVNYVHRDDVIGCIEILLDKQIWGETLNVVAPEHPTRKEVYERACREYNYEMPEFVDSETPHNFKIVSPKRLLDVSAYDFKYRNPLDFYYQRTDV